MNKIIRFHNLLNQTEKKKSYKLFLFIIVNNLAELLSIGMLIAAVLMLLDEKNQTFFLLNNYFNFEISTNNYYIYIVFFLTFSFILKNIISFQLYKYQFNFFKRVKRRITFDLFKHYINQPYKFFFEKNSSELLRNISIAAEYNLILSSLFMFYAEIILIIILFGMLLLVNPLVTLYCLLFYSILGSLFHFKLRKRVEKLGKRKLILEGSINKSTLETFHSIKEIQLYESENFFKNFFLKLITEYSIAEKKVAVFQQIPKLAFELAFVLGISFILIYVNYFNFTKSDYIIPLTAISLISIRLIPSISRIVAGLQRLKYYYPNIILLNEEFKKKFAEEKEQNNLLYKLDEFKELSVSNLNFQYDNNKNHILLKNLNFEINKNQITALVGESGSGKSTIADLIIGLISPQKGKIMIDDNDILDLEIGTFRKNIGYVSQGIFLFNDTIQRNLTWMADYDIKEDDIWNALKQANADEFVKKMPEKLDTIVGERGVQLSGGQRQRLSLARVFLKKPKVLILDEATSSLDSLTEIEIQNTIEIMSSTNEITFLIIAHRLSTIKNADKIIVLDSGNIVQSGDYTELVSLKDGKFNIMLNSQIIK